MRITIKFLLSTILLVVCLMNSTWVNAADSFVVDDIKVKGLHRIKLGTVLNYIPIKTGDSFSPEQSPKIIRSLFNTGFFQDVAVDSSGNTLIIVVVERATIGHISFNGNKSFKTKQLNSVLKQMGLVSGQVYQKASLDTLVRELRREYNSRGNYNAQISTNVTRLSHNRVGIAINISEGRVAKIKEIRFIGNEYFSDSDLRKQFQVSPSGLLTIFTRTDVYNKQRVDASLEAIRSLYLDSGFVNFKIESNQILLSEDKKDVHIVVTVDEGPRYYFSGYRLVGNLSLPAEELDKSVTLHEGDHFSRKVVTESIEAIKERYGDEGYGFPTITPEPQVDEQNKTVFVIFVISPGEQLYVRRINFKGNTLTADEVLRFGLRQEEGGLFALHKIRESERQLRVRRYVKDVEMKTIPVPGVSNQVDVDLNITEAPSAEAKASLGYGTRGWEISAGVNQFNLMGTGRTLGLNFSWNQFVHSLSLNYYNPFYTPSGIGRGFDIYYQKVTPGSMDLSRFSTNRIGAGVNFNIPIADTQQIHIGASIDRLELSIPSAPSNQMIAFLGQSGGCRFALDTTNPATFPTLFFVPGSCSLDYNQGRVSAGWGYVSFDRYPFPTRGSTHRIGGTVTLPLDNGFSYYKAEIVSRTYVPLFYDLIFVISGAVSYGNQFNGQGLPFFEHYYAGGNQQPGQIRGYSNLTVGPRETFTTPKGVIPRNPMGGNFLVSGSAALILPYPLSRESFRTSVFYDVGNVYQVNVPAATKGVGSNRLRMSAGVSVDWQSPFGPLSFSLAKPINPVPDMVVPGLADKLIGDDLTYFQFSVQAGL